jgi:hypothetical protein
MDRLIRPEPSSSSPEAPRSGRGAVRKSALYHAGRCLEICRANGIGDFDVAFAHEAMARTSAAMGDRPAFEEHFQQARGCGEQIRDVEDREPFFSDLESEPWFGMR